MQLMINGQSAAIQRGTTIKLTRTNPLVSEQGDYTMEVALPLSARANLDIFGSVSRAESDIDRLLSKRWAAQIVALPIVMAGEVRVTSVTNDTIKVQFVANKRLLMDALHGGEQYIDQLDLGESWRTFPEWIYYTIDGIDSWDPATMTYEEFKRALYHYAHGDGLSYHAPDRLMRGEFGDTDAVAFPAFAADEETVVNKTAAVAVRDRLNKLVKERGWFWMRKDSSELETPMPSSNPLSPQPYLFTVWRAMIKAIGLLDGDDSGYTSTWARNIFIVNAHASLSRAKALPHWTVAEFVREMEDFLGAVVDVDDDGAVVNIVPRASYYNGSSKCIAINKPLDERTTNFDEEQEQSTSSAGNVGYKWPEEDNILTLPAEVWNGANIKHAPNLTAIQQEVAKMSAEGKAQSPYLWVTHNARYALLHRQDTPDVYELAQIDQFPPLIRSPKSRDQMDTELRIVPARMKPNGTANNGHNTEWYGLPVLVSHTAERYAPPTYNIDAAINKGDATAPNSELPPEKDKPDVMTVALNAPDGWLMYDKSADGDGALKLPVGVPFAPDANTGFPVPFPHYLSLKQGDSMNPAGPFSLSEYSTGSNPGVFGTIRDLIDPWTGGSSSPAHQIDQRVEHHISFADDLEAYDPRKPYLINGALYACKQLELSIGEDGLHPVKRGIFYRLK